MASSVRRQSTLYGPRNSADHMVAQMKSRPSEGSARHQRLRRRALIPSLVQHAILVTPGSTAPHTVVPQLQSVNSSFLGTQQREYTVHYDIISDQATDTNTVYTRTGWSGSCALSAATL